MSVKLTSARFRSPLFIGQECNALKCGDNPSFCVCNKTADNKLPAVVLRNCAKSYWRGAPVIKDLNMTIQQGAIYSLLGSSGCGKSTTLSCIVGLTKFSSGNVWVFGKRPGGGQGVPGKSVGYMPQDYSLHDDFSIMETMTYFGMLNGLSAYQIINAIVFYTNLLKLPTEPKRVGSLSGGQKRRLSFAVALMHQPPLLILDEPTVGVDPLLRESIWKYLVELSTVQRTTVIITTHYIEEARCSDTIGVMRDGKLLAEKSPKELLQEYNTSSLETVVLNLCKIGEDARRRTENWVEFGGMVATSGINKVHAPPMAILRKEESSVEESVIRIRALVQKYMYGMMRSNVMLMMMIIIPVFSILLSFTCIGVDPSHIHFGVVNNELRNTSQSCNHLRGVWESKCELYYWSCKFLHHLPPDMFVLKTFISNKEAEKAAGEGKIKGFIEFPKDFSWEFYERAASGLEMNPGRLNDSNIFIRMDQTNSIITRQVQFALYDTLERFIKTLILDCNYNPTKAEFPLQYGEPLIRNRELNWKEYMLPGICLAHLHFYPIVSTGIRFVNEKRQGTMERSLVAGISMWEIFFAYSLTELATTVIKMAMMYAMCTWAFGMDIVGNMGLMFVLGILVAGMGVGMGFLFGSFCTEEVQVALLAIAVFVPNNILAGVLWPIEAMSLTLQSITMFLPCTLPAEAMRSLANRGWEFGHPNIWPGFLSAFLQMMICFVVAIIIATLKFIK